MSQSPPDKPPSKPAAKTAESTGAQNAQNPPNAQAQPIRWGMANLKSTYANFVHATSTREEVVLNCVIAEYETRFGELK